MNVCLVAGDFAESQILEQVSTQLNIKNHKVETFLFYGKKLSYSTETIRQAVCKADLVLLATSNNLDETLFAGNAASKHGVPFGIYAGRRFDMKEFEFLRPNTSFIFVSDQEDVASARKYFPKSKIVASGNPLWEDYFFPKLSRKEARQQMGAKDDETVILCSGDKDIIVNILLFGLVIEAAHLNTLAGLSKSRVVIGIHPGDLNPISTYADFCKFSRLPVTFLAMEKPVTEIPVSMDLKIMPTSNALPGADVVVVFASALGYEAACQRKPLINLFFEYGLNLLEKVRLGHRRWDQCENGTSAAVYGSNVNDLAWNIIRLTTPEGFNPYRIRQEAVYSKPPEKGSSVAKMVETLESLSPPLV